MSNLVLSEIWIYPVKSLGGIPLQTARAFGKGLEFDRRWMLIDAANIAMTQREYPQMAGFRVAIQDEELSITFCQNQRELSTTCVSTSPPGSVDFITATVWGDEVKVVEADRAVSRWFSDCLDVECRLVAFPEGNERPVDPKYSIGQDHVSLADAFPFLLIGQSSLDDLNRKLPVAVPMNRFRPNFVVTGAAPYQEDLWSRITIGTIPFAGVKKSARCTLITVDQETCQKGAEPLRTLSTYRKAGNKVYFGQNLIALGHGEIRVGDPVIPR